MSSNDQPVRRAYSWMPPEVGNAFLYAPWVAAPVMWMGGVLWDRSVTPESSTSVAEWLAYTIMFGVPLNYAALVLFGLPACYLLLRRPLNLAVFVLVGVTAGSLTSWIWPSWRLHIGWAVIGAVNGLIVWRAAKRAEAGRAAPRIPAL